MHTLLETIDSLTKPAALAETLPDGAVCCTACAHRCRLAPGRRGICGVRFNRGGTLHAPWGYTAAVNLDPIEKKPFAHLLPGSQALTFGMLGCNFHCDFCQNWLTTQPLRDSRIPARADLIEEVTPAALVKAAVRSGAKVVVSSYNEPVITAEWAVEIFRLARQAGLLTAFVSNGYATPEALVYLRPHLDAIKIDLKCMSDRHYRGLGGVLQNVLDSISRAHTAGLWVEVVTLVIPGFNNQPDELWEAARTLAAISPDIPWHVTAFHPDYRMTDRNSTPAHSLQQAAEIGQEAGLHYVYAGNLPGRVGSLEDTYCPQCQALLVQRRGYTVLQNRITRQGTCPQCGASPAGRWWC